MRLQKLDQKRIEDTSLPTRAYSDPLVDPATAAQDMLSKLEMCTTTLNDEINQIVAIQKPLNAFNNVCDGQA